MKNTKTQKKKIRSCARRVDPRRRSGDGGRCQEQDWINLRLCFPLTSANCDWARIATPQANSMAHLESEVISVRILTFLPGGRRGCRGV